MEYFNIAALKDGRKCIIRNAQEKDAEEVLDCFIRTHEESDFLASYADEITLTVEKEASYLQEKAENAREIELLAEVEGKVCGLAGISCIGVHSKTRHRAAFGISILKDHGRIGIGSALMKAAIECATKAAYRQIELEVVADNEAAIHLYENCGFKEYGRIPRGFNSRSDSYHDLIFMVLDLQTEKEK